MAVINGTNASETRTGGAVADSGNGYAGNDLMRGLGGADVLDGGQGNDTLQGGDGDDALFGSAGIYGPGFYGALGATTGSAGNDTIDGGAGNDRVSYAHGPANKGIVIDLAAGTAITTTGHDKLISIENATGSLFNDTILGSAGANAIDGFGGNDRIDGRGGNDSMRGGTGNDVMLGGTGNDTLLGDAGNDSLNGGAGNDVLWGTSGKDTYAGGAGADRFVFDFSDVVVGVNRNVVTDFSHAQNDRVDLSIIDADTTSALVGAFTFKGTGALTGAGQLRYGHTGGNTILQGSTDADAAAEIEIQFTGLINFVAADFVL